MKVIIYSVLAIVAAVFVSFISHSLGVTGYWQGAITGIAGCAFGNIAGTLAREDY